MERAVQHMAGFLAAGFLVVAAVLGLWQAVLAGELRSSPLNPRQIDWAREVQLGQMFDRQGRLLVGTAGRSPQFHRVYREPSLAPVVGYRSLRLGLSGLELTYADYLRGDGPGDPIGRLRASLLHQPPVGADLILTIDVDVQRAAAAALGDRAGAVVALDPRTGEVLALVSQPTYDPGRLEAEWERIREDPSHPLVNRATSGLYPPGSTFKVVTAAAAVELGKVDLQERFPCQEGVVVEGWHLPCKSPPQPPTLTFAQALAWSSNPVFARVGLDLASPTPIDLGDDAPRPYWWETHGVLDSFEVLRAYAERFGIGSSIPFDLPTEDGQIIASDEPTPVLVAATAFGQGELLVTPLHMALVAATVANDGLVPQPYLVAEIRQPNGVTLHPHRPGEGQRRAIKPETAAVLRDMMRLGVTEGWARTAALPNVAVAGKTGTAEVGGGADHHAWFIGFAPYEAPRVAVAVVVEHGGDGTAVAGPIAREVLAAALRRPDTREGAAVEAERNLERPTPAPPAEVVEPEPTPQPTARPVRRVRVGNTDGMGVYIRRTPNLDDKLRAWPDGTVLEVVGEEVEQNGVRWRRVRDPAGNTGWVPIQYTIPEE